MSKFTDWYERNKTQHNQKRRVKYARAPEAKKEQSKRYLEANRDDINKHRRENRAENKEKLNEKRRINYAINRSRYNEYLRWWRWIQKEDNQIVFGFLITRFFYKDHVSLTTDQVRIVDSGLLGKAIDDFLNRGGLIEKLEIGPGFTQNKINVEAAKRFVADGFSELEL